MMRINQTETLSKQQRRPKKGSDFLFKFPPLFRSACSLFTPVLKLLYTKVKYGFKHRIKAKVHRKSASHTRLPFSGALDQHTALCCQQGHLLVLLTDRQPRVRFDQSLLNYPDFLIHPTA